MNADKLKYILHSLGRAHPVLTACALGGIETPLPCSSALSFVLLSCRESPQCPGQQPIRCLSLACCEYQPRPFSASIFQPEVRPLLASPGPPSQQEMIIIDISMSKAHLDRG